MAFGEVGKIVKSVGQGLFNRTLGRLTGAGIATDNRIVNARAKWSGRNEKKTGVLGLSFQMDHLPIFLTLTTIP